MCSVRLLGFSFPLEDDQFGCLLDKLRFLYADLLDLDVVSGTNEELHLHGLDRNQRIVGFDLLTDLAVNLYDRAWHGALHKILFVKS